VVADVTIVGRGNGRPTPNPNVLIELGYALKSLGARRLILVQRSDTFKDSRGEHTTQLATTSFRVDLLEPGLDPAGVTIGPPNEERLYRELIKDTFPWCLVTIHM
jgi:hypothetical protein